MNFNYTTVSDDNGSPAQSELDAAANSYWQANPSEFSSHIIVAPDGTQTVYKPDLYFMCLPVQRSGEPMMWAVYGATDRIQPGWVSWPYDAVPPITPLQFAQALADAGHTVVLRKYSNFEITSTGTTITLS